MTNFEVVKGFRRAGSDQLDTTRHFSRRFGLHPRQTASLSTTQRLRKPRSFPYFQRSFRRSLSASMSLQGVALLQLASAEFSDEFSDEPQRLARPVCEFSAWASTAISSDCFVQLRE